MRKTLVILGALALLLTACRAESATRLRISAEGTATVISEFAFDEEALAIIGDLDDTPEDVLRALSEFIDPSALPVAASGVEPEQFSRGDLQGIRVTIPGLNPAEVATQLSAGDSIIDDISLTLTDGTLVLSGRTRDVPDFDRARLLSLVPGDLDDVLALLLQIEVPGSVTRHNADRLTGSILEWDLLPAIIDGESVVIDVEAQVDPGFQFVDLEGRPFAVQPEAESPGGGVSWWAAVLPFGLAALASWLIIRRMRGGRRLPEIEGFTPKG